MVLHRLQQNGSVWRGAGFEDFMEALKLMLSFEEQIWIVLRAQDIFTFSHYVLNIQYVVTQSPSPPKN